MIADLDDEIRERADECRREAARATKAADVMAWLSLADEWRKVGQANEIDSKTITATHAAAEHRSPFALV